jgi:hypothetical protein
MVKESPRIVRKDISWDIKKVHWARTLPVLGFSRPKGSLVEDSNRRRKRPQAMKQ